LVATRFLSRHWSPLQSADMALSSRLSPDRELPFPTPQPVRWFDDCVAGRQFGTCHLHYWFLPDWVPDANSNWAGTYAICARCLRVYARTSPLNFDLRSDRHVDPDGCRSLRGKRSARRLSSRTGKARTRSRICSQEISRALDEQI
jgi:hypothetical protein